MSPTARLVVSSRDPLVRARLRYAFAAYAALHGFRVVDDRSADVCVSHGSTQEISDVNLADGYRPRPHADPAPAPTWVDGMPCFHLAADGGPDILGEVFEWLGAPHENACTNVDEIGRIPPQRTLAGTFGLDRRVPWANRWLAGLHAKVRAALPRLPGEPPSPFGARRVFVASHDLDHLSGARVANARRVFKNVAISLLQQKDARAAARIVGAASRRIRRGDPTVVGVDELLAGEAARGVRATYTVVPESSHRRDPGYRLQDEFVTHTLRRISENGHELAVHGSYRSLERPGRLRREYELLAAAGFPASGGRQHWLRHRGAELFTALLEAGALWDSTLGHPDVIGFRHGAAFPFMPYDFMTESPFPVIEIPLVVMERALCGTSDDPAAWPSIAIDVLRAASADGWGGTAVLWHDCAFTGTTLPAPLADAYWDVLDAGDEWVTAAEMAKAARGRWYAAGVRTARATA